MRLTRITFVAILAIAELTSVLAGATICNDDATGSSTSVPTPEPHDGRFNTGSDDKSSYSRADSRSSDPRTNSSNASQLADALRLGQPWGSVVWNGIDISDNRAIGMFKETDCTGWASYHVLEGNLNGIESFGNLGVNNDARSFAIVSDSSNWAITAGFEGACLVTIANRVLRGKE